MKNITAIMAISCLCLSILFLTSCEQNEVFEPSYYECAGTYADSSDLHPKAAIYQAILEENQKQGVPGMSLLVIDKDGQWAGASGMADIASGIELEPCHPFLIASISKIFTATTIFALVDDGILSVDDTVSKWLSDEIVENVANTKEATIGHLLSHRSGIPDHYTTMMEMDRINNVYNDWRAIDMLKFTYGKPADFAVGETYAYSNTNYILLGLIIESASGKSMGDMYAEKIFNPLGLQSAYYGTTEAIPAGTVKGYADIYDNGQIAETRFMYEDELNTGDGGVIINTYDLAKFLNGLNKGLVISQSSLDKMKDWFDLPENWIWEAVGQTKNGFGFEYFAYQDTYAVGHTGGVDGFSTYAFYYPEEDMTFVLFSNFVGDIYQLEYDIINRCLAEMFE